MTGTRPTLVGLTIDDNEHLARSIQSRLTGETAKLGIDLTWSPVCTDPDRGLELIRDHDYDVVVADVIFLREDGIEEPRLDIVEAARIRSETSYLISVSSASGEHDRASNLHKARILGADVTVQREDFRAGTTDSSPDRIALGMRLALTVRGRLPGVSLRLEPARDPRIQAVVQQIGAPVIGELYRQCVGTGWGAATEVAARYLTPGASGSAVIQLEATAGDGGRFRHVMKLNRDPEVLRREVIRGKLLESHVENRVFLRPDSAAPVGPVGGWFGLVLPFSETSRDLRGWISEAEPSDVERLLTVLFEENLANMYLRTGRTTTEPTPLEDMMEVHFRTVRVAAALRRVKGALHRATALSTEQVDELETAVNDFFGAGTLFGRPASAFLEDNWRCQVHGDLHGGNVLVYLGALQSPTLIDTSEVGEGHWAADAARLHVDLVLEGTAGTEEALFWDDLERWRVSSRAAAVGEDADASSGASLIAATWLSRNLDRWALPARLGQDRADWLWTWHLALANQYARAMYRQTLPPPVVALAALGSYDQLRAAAESVPAARHGQD